MFRSPFLATFFCGIALAASARAHDPGLSSAAITVSDRTIAAAVTFNARDLASIAPNAAADYSSLDRDILRVSVQSEMLLPKLSRVRKDQNENITFELSYARSPGTPLQISSGVIDRLPFGHRQFVSIHTGSGASLGDRLLSARENVIVASIPHASGPTAGPRFLDFFVLGLRHILTGYDHLLFLFGLLIVSRNVRSAALLITCFTAAHSLTLALSTFGLVNLQSRIVEPAIAASIVYVGIENLFREKSRLRWRWILTFAFGLIHGLGFAAVLREMGVGFGGGNAVVPLFAFNLGVEAGQLSVAAIVLPIIWKLRQRPAFLRRGVPACSLLVALAGGYWLVERMILS
ncbi:MAG: HupE / UreJ protein [Spartobacteria bacterium]|nr:HupE / UreJ protein [Spartobacteria bacterium]